jgi:hypothetical protein
MIATAAANGARRAGRSSCWLIVIASPLKKMLEAPIPLLRLNHNRTGMYKKS